MIGLLRARRNAQRAAERAETGRRTLSSRSNRILRRGRERLVSPSGLLFSFCAGVATGALYLSARKRSIDARNDRRSPLGTAADIAAAQLVAYLYSDLTENLRRQIEERSRNRTTPAADTAFNASGQAGT